MQRIGLFTPIKINSMELSNRVIMSPMFTNSAAPGGFVSKNTIKHYVDRARSGVGLIMTEHTSVSSTVLKNLSPPCMTKAARSACRSRIRFTA